MRLSVESGSRLGGGRVSDSFDASVWAICICAFWGMMQLGEATVTSRGAFNHSKHLKRQDVFLGNDLDNNPYARLDLPSAKTAKPGEIQQIYLVGQEETSRVTSGPW